VPRLIRQALEKARVGGQSRVSTGVDVVGDLAIVRLGGFKLTEKKKIAKAMLAEMANVKGVFEQEGGIEGELRLRSLRHLAGVRRTLTLHRENGCAFKVDVARCYFSPRLSTERMRLAALVGKKEKVLNMFAGVGPFSIPIAKLAGAKVVSCELNEYACELHLENDALNKVEPLVDVMNCDVLELPGRMNVKFDRVIMPFPSGADRFLPTALRFAKKNATIHYYRHVLGRDEDEAKSALAAELSGVLPKSAKYKARKVRAVGPRWLEMVADVKLAG
jgi:tRNA (guanine37-N1)-methyltransferase